jgi:hypothetical protein
MMQLSASGDKYSWLCTKLLPFVVGYKKWIKSYYKEPMSSIATCSDEAFMLLTLDNNYARWMEEALWIEHNKDKDEKDRTPRRFVASKYTNSGKSQANGRNKTFQGWAREGYLKFNELYQKVAEDRRTRAAFENKVLVMLRRDVQTQEEESDSEEEEDEIYPANDLLGVNQHVARSRHQHGRKDDLSESEGDDPYTDTPGVDE